MQTAVDKWTSSNTVCSRCQQDNFSIAPTNSKLWCVYESRRFPITGAASLLLSGSCRAVLVVSCGCGRRGQRLLHWLRNATCRQRAQNKKWKEADGCWCANNPWRTRNLAYISKKPRHLGIRYFVMTYDSWLEPGWSDWWNPSSKHLQKTGASIDAAFLSVPRACKLR